MKHPRIIICELDGWLAKQLRELAAENRWLVRSTRSIDTALSFARERGPAVLLVQFEPAEEKPDPLRLIADVHRLAPDVPVIAIADSKVPDAERTVWTAALLDLGSRYVLFPPLTKSVLEDVVSGLMAATIARVMGNTSTASPQPIRTTEPVIDLADEDPES